MRILIVDDSVVFRSQIKSALDDVEGITVVGVAANGRIALDRLSQVACDVITLDLEMPEMNGIQTLEAMRKAGHKQRVIVFAAPTKDGATMAFEAMRAGASDFVAKPHGVSSLDDALTSIKKDLVPKILQFAKKDWAKPDVPGTQATLQQLASSSQGRSAAASVPKYQFVSFDRLNPRAIGIGSSTGGPTALESIFSQLKGLTLNVPIFVAQHMPPHFTDCLAKRLELLSGIPAAEGVHNEVVKAGRIYVAPGDYHMSLVRSSEGTKVTIALDQGPKRNSVRPAVDTLFESMAKIYGNASAVFVLTGMGEDGKIGAEAIKEVAGGVMIQDRDSSVVWGMPGAIHQAQAFDLMGNLDQCAAVLKKLIS